MKHVFANSREVIHLFAQRTQEQDHARGGRVFFDNKRTIYSYGHHFPLATFHDWRGKTVVLCNEKTYSSTTGSHQGEIRRAMSQYDMIRVVDTLEHTNVVKWFHGKDSLTCHERNLKHFQSAIESTAKRVLSCRKNIERHISAHENEIDNANKYLKFFSVKHPKFKSLVKNKDFKARIDAEKENEKEHKKAEKLLQEHRLKLWINHEKDVNGYEVERVNSEYQYLRMKNADTIETSKGVEFPLSHGVLALRKIRNCVNNKVSWHKNGEEIRLSHFRVDSISPEGDVVAGCHKIQYSETERFAKANNL